MKFVIIRLARIALNARSVPNVLGSKSSKRIAGFTCNRLTHQLTVTSVGLMPGMHHGIWKTPLHCIAAPSPLHSITNCFAKILHHFHLLKQKPFLSISGRVSCRWIGRRWRLRLRRSPLSNSSSNRAYLLSSRSPRSRPKWPEIEIMRRASSWTATNFVAPSAFHKTTQVSKIISG